MDMFFKNVNNYAKDFDELQAFFMSSNKKKDWADDKSAKTLATYVSLGDFSNHMSTYLKENFNAKFKEDAKVVFEKCTKFDESSRGPRDHDLCTNDIVSSKEKITVCVEAKVNETFSKLNVDQLKHSMDEMIKRPKSKLRYRLKNLFYVFSNTKSENFNKEKWGEFLSLRYQLFTGLAGTIAEAKVNNSDKAVFMIIAFKTKLTDNEKAKSNHQDYLDFLDFLGVDKEQKAPYKLERILENSEDFKVNYCCNDIDIYIDYLTIEV